MSNYVRSSIPRVPNRVNPVEDFADKWHDPSLRHLQLEENFWLWLEQAQEDFLFAANARDVSYLEEQVSAKFATTLNVERLKERSVSVPLMLGHVPRVTISAGFQQSLG